MRKVVVVGLLAVLAMPCILRASDLDDLKAAHEGILKAINARDAQACAAGFYDREVRFSAEDPFPSDREKASLPQELQRVFAMYESWTVVPVNLEYRVIGTTGLVWGYHRNIRKPKDGPMQSTLARQLSVYVKTDGKWLRAASHLSAVPSGN
jgi:ketosteroid isomerase-like protein